MASPQAPITKLRRAITGLARVQGSVVDIAAECETYEDAERFYVVLYDLNRMTGDMLDVAQTRMVELTMCDCSRDDDGRAYHLDTCAIITRFKPRPLPGSGILKFSGGKERTRYDQTAIVGALSKGIGEEVWTDAQLQAIVDVNGEDATPLWPKVVHAIATLMAEATGALAPSFDSWRSGVAKRFGIKLNDYAETITSDVKVRIEGRDRP